MTETTTTTQPAEITRPKYRVDVFYIQPKTDIAEDGTFEHYTELQATSFGFNSKKEAEEKYTTIKRSGYLTFDLPYGESRGSLRVEALNIVNNIKEGEFNERTRIATGTDGDESTSDSQQKSESVRVSIETGSSNSEVYRKENQTEFEEVTTTNETAEAT